MRVEDIEQLHLELESVCLELGVDDPDSFDINQLVNKIREYGQDQFDAGVESVEETIKTLQNEIEELRFDLQEATGRSY